MRRMIQGATILVAIVGVGASAAHYLTEAYNPGFAQLPLTVAVHVALGGIYLALAPVQFLSSVRRSAPTYHRRAGRTLVVLGLIAGLSAMVMSLIIPFSGNAERLLVTPFAGYFIYALCVAVGHIRAGRVEAHRAWMIRAFAVASSIATMRLIFVPMLTILGVDDIARIQTMSVTSFLVAFVIHITVAEWWIARTTVRREGHRIIIEAT